MFEELKLQASRYISFTSMDSLREIYYKKFREEEKERGYGLNSFVRGISQDYEIQESEELHLEEGEMLFDCSMFSEEPIISAEPKQKFEDYNIRQAKEFAQLAQQEKEVVYKKVVEVKEPLKERVIPPKEPQRSVQNSMPVRVEQPKRVSKVVEQVPSNTYKTLAEFIKLHPNCTIQEASKYFSTKDIQKQVKIGKVYLRKGRLSV